MNEPHNWTRVVHEWLAWADSHETLACLIFAVIVIGILRGAIAGGTCFCKNCEKR